LNARAENFRVNDRVLTVPISHESRLLAVVGATLLLYNPRDAGHPFFYGVGRIEDVVPSRNQPRSVDVLFEVVEKFPGPLILQEMIRLIEAKPRPFHTYSPIVWSLPDLAYDQAMARLATSSFVGLEEDTPNPFKDETHKMRLARIRSARVRNRTYVLYGRACLFCGELTPDLSGHKFGTVIIHLVPLKNGGPDSVRNTFPACSRCHFLIDNGVMGLDDTGLILIAIQYRGPLPESLRRHIDLSLAQLGPKLDFIRWHRERMFGKGPTNVRFRLEPQAPYEFG
jgi:hypothetical protein